MKLTANQALQLIENFRGKNENDRWIDHCVSVGNTAGKIAGALKDKSYNIDVDKTIALGYVHDIGKYTDKTHKHDIKGYEYLIGKGYDEDYCNICLTHSYLNNDITCTAGGVPDITENPFLTNFVKNHEYTIYEKIINLCDLMCTKVNMTLEKRLIDIMVRRGVHDNTVYHIKEAQKLKEQIDEMLGHNVYDLFPDVLKN